MVIASMFGVLLTKWTIRLALACYVVYLASALLPAADRRARAARAIWTAGWVLFVVHVACAFHFYHHWSHAVAWQHTAERTKELLGIAVGDGIYFSYLFLILWGLDVVWVWRSSPHGISRGSCQTAGSPAGSAPTGASDVPCQRIASARTPAWRAMVHLFLLFVAANGAIVFEAGPTRWAGLAAALALACLAVCRRYNWLSAAAMRSTREKVHEPGGAEAGV